MASLLQIFVGDQPVGYSVGHLEYVGSSAAKSEVLGLPTIIAIVAAIAGFLLTIVVLVCVAYTVKSRKSARAMRRMRNQMDVLESRVAKECKEG